MKKWLIPLAGVLFFAFPLPAMDVGLVLDQNLGYLNGEEYSGILIPWFSIPLDPAGKTADLYVSLGLWGEYKNSQWNFAPELLRTELDWRFGDFELKTGRLSYTDPLAFVAQGLFDGSRLSLSAGNSRFEALALYTGLLYKKSARITMTAQDLRDYSEKLDVGNIGGTYFASRRVILALGWETIAAEILRLNLATLGQFDVNNGERFHSQYVEGKLRVPVQSFVFNAAFCLEPQMAEGKDLRLGMAGELGVDWSSPLAMPDRLSLFARISSGHAGDVIAAFVPITAIAQGKVLKAKLSGLSMFQLIYTARLHRSFSASVESSYFVLNDKGTYQGWPAGKEGYFLGNEFYGQFVWSPVSDLNIQTGGGVFLPSLGNAAPGEQPRWYVECKAVLALF